MSNEIKDQKTHDTNRSSLQSNSKHTTFDAIFCCDNICSNILSSLSEIWRVLKNNGFFIEISFGRPKNRLNCFKKSDENWKFFDPIVIMNNAYFYVLQKIDNKENK